MVPPHCVPVVATSVGAAGTVAQTPEAVVLAVFENGDVPALFTA